MGNSSSNSGAVAFTVPGTGIDGVETPTWRNISCERNNGELIATPWPDVSTLHEAFVYVQVLTHIFLLIAPCVGGLKALKSTFCVWRLTQKKFANDRRGVETHPHNPCFGIRPLAEDGKTRGEYEWEDYKSVLAKVKDIASGLRQIDLAPVRYSHHRLPPFFLTSRTLSSLFHIATCLNLRLLTGACRKSRFCFPRETLLPSFASIDPSG